jgi:hypothetical protein
MKRDESGVPMKCEDLLKMLNDYVDGDIDLAVSKEFVLHLADCLPCRIVLDTTRRTITLYRGDEPCEMPPAFRTRLYEAVRKKWESDGPRPKD